MTELSPVCTVIRPSAPFEKKCTTVGRAAPMAEIKLINEQGKIVPRGQEGEVCVRGYLVMKEYWDDPEKTKESIDENGWMHSGDLGKLDEDGYLQISGRVKDLIIRGGENISPKEIEECFGQNELVRDVQVVGSHCDHFGEEVTAWIVPQNIDSEASQSDKQDLTTKLLAHSQEKLAHYKQPKYIRIVDEFPLTVTGKVKKNIIREVSNGLLKENSPEMIMFSPSKNKAKQ